MTRPIFTITLGSISGIIMGVYLIKSIPIIFVFLITCIFFIWIKYKIYRKTILVFFVSLCIFIVISHKINYNYDNKYKELNEKEIKVVGTVISDVEEKQYKKSCKIKIEAIDGNKKYRGDILLLYFKKEIEIDYADKISFIAVYKEPDVARNYNGFNYKEYLKTEKVYGLLYNEKAEIKVIRKNKLNILSIENHKVKKKFEELIKRNLPDRTANLEMGILLGYSKEIDKDIKDAFQNSNITHMLAVSGENTMYVIILIGWICNKKIFGIRGQKIISIIMIFWFVKLTGATLSVVRAGITAIVYLLGSLFHRKSDVINTMSIAVLTSILENPFSIFNSGMQLSYAGTLSIILFYNLYNKEYKSKIKKYILDNIKLTFCANILIIPITMYHFNTISLTFLLSNFIEGPLVGIATIMGFLMVPVSIVFPFLSRLISIPLNLLLEIIIKIAEIFSKFKISKIYVVTPSICEIVLIYISLFYVYKKIKKKRKIDKRIISVIIIIILLFRFSDSFISKDLTIHFVDVGQGDCTLITTPKGKKILIDGGGNENSDSFDVGKNTLIPYLLDRKISKINYIIISHFDSDHVRGTIKCNGGIKG